MEWLNQLMALAQIILAMVLGGLIGLERELAQKPAGFRTQMLVAGASALFIMLGKAMAGQMLTTKGVVNINYDPVRVVQAIVVGIGFIGAGSIIRSRSEDRVEGLTTAASILTAAAVGISVAIDQYILAIGMTVITLLILWGLGIFDRRVVRTAKLTKNESNR